MTETSACHPTDRLDSRHDTAALPLSTSVFPMGYPICVADEFRWSARYGFEALVPISSTF